VNEVYLIFWIEVDEHAAVHSVSRGSEFASVYKGILPKPSIGGSRVCVASSADFTDMKWIKKF
jgi:hypothetical protein